MSDKRLALAAERLTAWSDGDTMPDIYTHDALDFQLDLRIVLRALGTFDAELTATQAWQPTHVHRKGGQYRVIGRGSIEADLSDCVIYDDDAGRIWVRPAAEFDDGRFTPLPPPPALPEPT